MTNNDIREILPQLIEAGENQSLFDSKRAQEIHQAIKDIIDSEESAWAMLRELRESDEFPVAAYTEFHMNHTIPYTFEPTEE